MAVSLVQSVQMLNSTASATTYNSATTITTSGGLAIAYISGESDTAGASPSISSLTLGGNAMTVQGAIVTTAGGRAWAAVAILNNASVSGATISLTTTATQRAMAIRVAEWTGHDTTTPIAQNFGNGGGSGSTSLTASSALINAGGVYTGVVTVDSGTANTSIVANATETVFATSGQTGTSAFSDCSWQSGYEAHATTGTYSFGFNWTGANFATLKVVEIKAAAGGISGAANDTFALAGASQGAVIVSGTAPGTLAFSGAAAGGVQVSGNSSGLLDLGGVAVGAVADTALPPIQLVHVDDAPSWKSLFYKRLDDLDEALDEVVAAEEPQQVAAEIVAEFTPADVPDAMPKLAGMLASLAEAGKRKAIERQARAIQAEIKRAKDERRRRMNNEAALLLLVA